jgi:hypothetical protein
MGEEGMKALIIGGVLVMGLCLAGCASPRPEPFARPSAAASLAAPVLPVAPSVDSCGISELAWLVGRPKTEIPVPVDPSSRRVYCATCVITEDKVPERQNIVFDPDTGLVLRLGCG